MSGPNRLIYFDHAATSFPKPPGVATAMEECLTRLAVNPGRSGFDLSLEAGRLVDGVRGRLDRLFNNPAADPDRTVFTANATGALNLALQGLCRPGDHVVSTVMEHNSVLRPLFMMEKAGIITHDLAACGEGGRVDPATIEALLRPSTRLVVMTHASNICGAVQPVAEIGALCRDRGLVMLLDAAQTAGAIPVDMAELRADLVAFTGHKSLLGPTGIGGLVVGPDVEIRSSAWGGTGVQSALREHPDDFPWKLETGTLNTVGIAGLAASLDWLDQQGMAALHLRVCALADRFLAGCTALDGVRVHGFGNTDPTRLGPGRLPVLSVTVAGRTCEEVGLFLDADWNIGVRTGVQCAPLAHAALGTAPEGSVRFSFGPFNTELQIDTALDALADLAP